MKLLRRDLGLLRIATQTNNARTEGFQVLPHMTRSVAYRIHGDENRLDSICEWTERI
jgi:hypothetical protein